MVNSNYDINLSKPKEGRCSSLDKNESGDYVQCNAQGIRRYNNKLDSGIHCDEHWEKLVIDCRKRSW